MKQTLACIAILIALAACMTPQKTAPTAPVKQPWEITDAAECAKANGSIRPVCMMGKPTCVVNYPDAGKTCRDKADCQGNCYFAGPGSPKPDAPATGKCSADSDPCGCRTAIVNGKAQWPLCVD